MLTENIRLIRKKWRYSQGDFAALFDLNRGNINSYENGYTEPTISFMVKLSQLSGISVEEIYTQEVDETNVSDQPLGAANRKDVASKRRRLQDQNAPSEELSDYFNLMDTVKDLRSRTERLEERMGEENDEDGDKV